MMDYPAINFKKIKRSDLEELALGAIIALQVAAESEPDGWAARRVAEIREGLPVHDNGGSGRAGSWADFGGRHPCSTCAHNTTVGNRWTDEPCASCSSQSNRVEVAA